MAYIHDTCLVCISLLLLSKNSSFILLVCLFFFVLLVGWFSGKGKCWGPYYRHHLLRSVQLHPQPKNYNLYVVIAHVAQC